MDPTSTIEPTTGPCLLDAPATESAAVRPSAGDEMPAPSSPTTEESMLPAMTPPAVDEGAEHEVSAELSAPVDLVTRALGMSLRWQWLILVVCLAAEEKEPVPTPPVPASWGSLDEYAGRDSDVAVSAPASEPADADAARGRLSEMRQLADQRLSELLAVRLASSSTLDRPDEWEVLVPSAVAPIVAELADVLQVGAPILPEEPSPGTREPLADVADALALVAFLQKTFGAPRLRERIESTARVCSWLTHVADSLLAVIRVQDMLLALPHAESPASALELVAGWESAQVRNLARRLEAREEALREEIQRRRDAETSQQRAVAGEVEAIRQHEILLGLYDQLQVRVKRATVDLAEGAARQEQLETRVRELEGELAAAFRQVLPALNADQAQHMYDFVWRYGCGQGDERAWATLVEACALDDPSRVPVDISFLMMRAGRSTRVVHAAPDREHLDVSSLAGAPAPTIKSSSSSARAATSTGSTASASATDASRESSLSTSARHSSTAAASARRAIQFQRDGADDDDVGYVDDAGPDEWDRDDDAAKTEEQRSAKDAARRRESRSASPFAAAPAPAPPVSATSLRDVSTQPPVIHVDDTASDASSDGPRTPRGVKRRVPSTVAANAITAQRLARTFGTEGIDAFSPPAKRRSSPSSLSTPSSATPSDRSARAVTTPASSNNDGARVSAATVAARDSRGSGAVATPSAPSVPAGRSGSAILASSTLGVSPRDEAGALPPLTFVGPEAAPRIADYTSVPRAVGNDVPSGVVFPQVSLPFALGSTRGRSSTVAYDSLSDLHLRELLGISMQRSARGQSPYFPNYEPVRNQTELQLARLGPRGIAALDDVLDSRPWDRMWRERVTHVFLFNPNALSQVQVDWLFRVLGFMYQYRRQYWQRQHWYALSRQASAGQDVIDAYSAREASNRDLVVAFNALIRAAPPGISTSLFWSEPAFWWVAAKPCAWPLADVSTTPLAHQLAEIDLLEPVRCCWSNEPGRFVEALIAEQLEILDSHGGKCWQLPAPWCDPDFRPDV